MSGFVVGGIIGSVLLVVAVVLVLAVRRGRARRVPDRDELRRRGSVALGQMAKDKRHVRRGTLRRGGLGEGTNVNEAATWGNDGPAGLP